jgi:RNA polymerase sigma factor (sigma-70 family)
MSTEDPPSVTRWIEALKEGRSEAAAVLWKDYWSRLTNLARKRLGGARSRAVEDEEDVALSAFLCLCRGAAAGRFERLADRGDLWRLLVAITANKIRAHRQRHGRRKRGGGTAVLDEAAFADAADSGLPGALAQILSAEPDPELAAQAAEQCNELFNALPDDDLRQIAAWRMEGLTNAEIATRLGRVERTIGRKLERIRAIWIELACESLGEAAPAQDPPAS